MTVSDVIFNPQINVTSQGQPSSTLLCMSVLGQSLDLLSSILTILLTCPNKNTLLSYSNEPYLTVHQCYLTRSTFQYSYVFLLFVCLVCLCVYLGGYGYKNCHVCLGMCCVCIILKKGETITSEPKQILSSWHHLLKFSYTSTTRFNAACICDCCFLKSYNDQDISIFLMLISVV